MTPVHASPVRKTCLKTPPDPQKFSLANSSPSPQFSAAASLENSHIPGCSCICRATFPTYMALARQWGARGDKTVPSLPASPLTTLLFVCVMGKLNGLWTISQRTPWKGSVFTTRLCMTSTTDPMHEKPFDLAKSAHTLTITVLGSYRTSLILRENSS